MANASAPQRVLHILVLYSAYTTRANLLDSLYSFRRHTRHRICYFNLAAREMPDFVVSQPWDLVVLHTLFFSRKFEREQQRAIFRKVQALAAHPALKVLTPQDEFINSDIVVDFAKAIGARRLCSVQPASEWRNLYGAMIDAGVEVVPVLTGYIDEGRVREYRRFLAEAHPRPVDVGYRTIGRPVAWFGRHGFLKELIAHRFAEALRGSGLRQDISTEDKDSLLATRWYDFLGRCRYTLGVEGGTSILDRDGSIRQRTDAYVATHPDAPFAAVEAACFPGVDGSFAGFAVSPRHLEACMTGTCQILTAGDYSGVLRAGVHYIPVAKDLSDVDAVVASLGDEARRRRIVEQAWRDIVQSGRYSMARYPQAVIGDEAAYARRPLSLRQRLAMRLVHLGLRLLDAADRIIAVAWVGSASLRGKRPR